MQCRLPSSLYSIIRVPLVHNGHTMTRSLRGGLKGKNSAAARKLHKFQRDDQKWLFGLEVSHRTLSN